MDTRTSSASSAAHSHEQPGAFQFVTSRPVFITDPTTCRPSLQEGTWVGLFVFFLHFSMTTACIKIHRTDTV